MRRRPSAFASLPDADETAIPFVTIDPPESLTSTRHSMSNATARAIASAMRSQTSPRSSRRAGRWISRLRRGDRRCTRRTGTPASIHQRCPKERGACFPTRFARLCMDDGARCDGRGRRGRCRRAPVRSREKLDYAGVQRSLDEGSADESLQLLREVGLLRQEREKRLGGIDLPIPEQELDIGPGGYELDFRAPLPVERWNAQISLMTGQAAAQLMLSARVGVLRTLPTADGDAVGRLRRRSRGARNRRGPEVTSTPN